MKIWMKRTLIALTVAVVLGAGGYIWFISSSADRALSKVKRDDLIDTASTPFNTNTYSPSSTLETKAENYLLIGADTRGEGDPGRSDTMMVVHLPKDRSKAYLISLPRDSYVEIPDHGKNKLNAAYAYGQSPLTAKTVEGVLDTKIDHVAIVNFRGFMRIIDSIGGVTVNNPVSVYDDSQNVSFPKGELYLDRDLALKYVRSRHGWPNGDLDRAKNQQRVLKAIAAKMLSAEVLADPVKMSETLTEVSKHVTVDHGMTNEKIKSTLFGLKIRSGEDLVGITLPVKGSENLGSVGDVVMLDEEKLEALKTSLKNDTVGSYVDAEAPKSPSSISSSTIVQSGVSGPVKED